MSGFQNMPDHEKAIRAQCAWTYAEREAVGSFDQRMELSNATEFYAAKALAEIDGIPFDRVYSGVPHMVVWPEVYIRRETEERVWELIEEVLQHQRGEHPIQERETA